MNKKILFSLVLVFVFVGSVKAESAENVTKRRPDRTEQVQIQEIRQESKEKREEIKSKFGEMRSDVAENHANRLEKRFNFYYTRLSDIITRFQKRLDTFKSEGIDTTSVQAKLTAAKTKLEEAKLKGQEAVASFKAIDPAKFSEQKAETKLARDQANSARKLYKDTHDLLKEALKSLKLVSKPALPAASATTKQ